MTIDKLIERLEEYREELGGDVVVRLMTQPSWPVEYTIAGVASGIEINEAGYDPEAENDNLLYIVEGQQLGYGTKYAWEAAH